MGLLQLIGAVLIGLVIKELAWGAVRTWIIPWYDRRKEKKYVIGKFSNKK
jgi:hypothetical protein